MRWWAPRSMGMVLAGCEMDVREGGKYRVKFGDPSADWAFFGKYLEVVTHARLVWTNDEDDNDHEHPKVQSLASTRASQGTDAGPERTAHEAAIALVHRAEGDLRHGAVLVVDRVAGNFDFQPDDVLADFDPAQGQAGAVCGDPEIVPVQRQLDAVVKADRNTGGIQAEVRCLHGGEVGVGADAVAAAVAGDQRPRHQAAAAGSFDLSGATGEQQFALIPAEQGLRLRDVPGAKHDTGE